MTTFNFGMQGTSISVVLLRVLRVDAPDAARWASLSCRADRSPAHLWRFEGDDDWRALENVLWIFGFTR